MVEPLPFATVQDLRDRWPDFPAGAESHASVLLEDASQFILDVCPRAADASPFTRRRIVCSVVRRTMEAGQGDAAGLESQSWASGPFSATSRPANPHGDFYLTKQERTALGGDGRPKAFGVQIAGFTAASHRPWCSLAFGAGYCSCGADLTQGDPLWEA